MTGPRSSVAAQREVSEVFERAETTLCLVVSLDGKITTGSTDNLDSDLDWKRVVGVKEGFSQYYKVEQSLGPNYLNSGRVLEKVGFNDKREAPKKGTTEVCCRRWKTAFEREWNQLFVQLA